MSLPRTRAQKGLERLRILRKETPLSGFIRYVARSLLGSRRPVRVGLAGAEILIRPRTPDLRVATGNLARGEFQVLENLVPELRSGLVVDAGGYIGTAAIALARIFPGSQVLSLEPSGDNYELLERNVAAYPKIIPVKKALAPTDGTLDLFRRGEAWGDTVVPLEGTGVDGPPAFLETVETVSVESLLRERERAGIDVLKLDVEGAEKELMAGPPAWVDRVGVFMIELHDRFLPGCAEAVKRATRNMRQVLVSRDKLVIVNDAYFS